MSTTTTKPITLAGKKITLATVKSFIKAHHEELYINLTSGFDGMVDGVRPVDGGFKSITDVKERMGNAAFTSATIGENTLGVPGAWFVLERRDYFTYYNKLGFEGIEVSNSCGSFILAIRSK